jgi:putative pyruvate formate lyase activating enzyme
MTERQNSSVVEQLTRNEQVLGSSPSSGFFMPDLVAWLKHCEVCPNRCGADRLRGQTGACRLDDGLFVSAADLHYGEESVLVGRGGSGTIFFTACNLKCVYCQNYDISQLDRGRRVSSPELVRLMLSLQQRGAENINLVTPTHQAPQIFSALESARRQGLSLPVVYNCGGYENPEFLRSIAGLVDIYMPDYKYGSAARGRAYSGVENYPRHCQAALHEMHRQVGDLVLNSRRVAVRGLLVRHLVLPGGLADSRKVLEFISRKISRHTFLNIMDQYRPCHRAAEYHELNRRIYRREYEEVLEIARTLGMTRVCA